MWMMLATDESDIERRPKAIYGCTVTPHTIYTPTLRIDDRAGCASASISTCALSAVLRAENALLFQLGRDADFDKTQVEIRSIHKMEEAAWRNKAGSSGR